MQVATKSLPLIDITIWSLKKLVDECQLGLKAVEPNAEGLVDPAEMECFNNCITVMREREEEIDREREAERLAAMSLGSGSKREGAQRVRGRRYKRSNAAANGKTESQG